MGGWLPTTLAVIAGLEFFFSAIFVIVHPAFGFCAFVAGLQLYGVMEKRRSVMRLLLVIRSILYAAFVLTMVGPAIILHVVTEDIVFSQTLGFSWSVWTS